MENSSYQILGLSGAVALLMFVSCGSIIWFSDHKPYAPKFSLDSVTLQNINMSSDQATADWNFNFSVKNMNQFGWSYGLSATLYNDGNYDSSREDIVGFYAMDTTIPNFTQGGNNDSSFSALFEGVSLPITNRWISSQESGDLFSVPLVLTLEGKIEPIPQGSLPRIVRWFASHIHVECKKVKTGISRDCNGAIHAYLGRGSYCSSR